MTELIEALKELEPKEFVDFVESLQELSRALKHKPAKSTRMKATRPDLSLQISKATSAQEVADAIQSAWLTYGASDVQPQEDGSFTFTILGQEWATFDGAMKYLWFKTAKKDPNTYTMQRLPYKVVASKTDDSIEVTVLPEEASK